MIQIGLCDDDLAILSQLQVLLGRYQVERNAEITSAAFQSPLELLAEIEKGMRFDILLLDVLMPGENGIDAAREIRWYDTAVQIIFVTSSSEFAVQSYVVGAYYYQLKPIWKDSFFRLTDAVLAECRKRASTYRHDLRHHMQFLAGCIENGRTEQALGYIRSVCSEIEAGKVTAYCENEAANLIFSAFADRAAKAGVQFTVQAGISQALPVSESDLCVLLSNALENALHAAVRCREAGQGAFIETTGHEKGKKLFLQITNSCLPDVQFREGIPVTDRTGHGLGVRSICAISERYGGLTSFAAKDGQFTLRVML